MTKQTQPAASYQISVGVWWCGRCRKNIGAVCRGSGVDIQLPKKCGSPDGCARDAEVLLALPRYLYWNA